MANVNDAPPTDSWRKSVYPVYIEAQAGIGSKPVDLFAIDDDKDAARSWTKVVKNVTGFIFALGIAASSYAGTLTPNLGLNKWTRGDTDYLAKQNADQNTLDAAILDKRVGGTILGDLRVNGSIIGAGGVVGGGSGGGALIFQDLLPQVDGLTADFVLTSTPPAGSTIDLYMDGLRQVQNVDFTVALAVLTMTTAPAANTTSFVVASSSSSSGGSTSTVTVNSPLLGIGSLGNPLRVDTSSVTLLGPKIDLGELSFTPATNVELAQIGSSTRSLQNQIDFLTTGGGSTVAVSAPITGSGAPGNPLGVDSSSVTLLGNTFNAASKLVKLDASAKLPALDGSALTNLPAQTGTDFGPSTGTLRIDLNAEIVARAAQGSVLSASTVSLAATQAINVANVASLSLSTAALSLSTASLASSLSAKASSGTNNDVTRLSALNTISSAFTHTSSMTNTSSGGVLATSSMTASGFFGDGYGLSGFAVVGSSESTTTTSVASAIFVGIGTATVVMRGSRPTLLMAEVGITNNAVAARDYTCRLTENGVAIGNDELVTAGVTSTARVSILRKITSTGGSRSYGFLCRSSNATSVQNAVGPVIGVLEL